MKLHALYYVKNRENVTHLSSVGVCVCVRKIGLTFHAKCLVLLFFVGVSWKIHVLIKNVQFSMCAYSHDFSTVVKIWQPYFYKYLNLCKLLKHFSDINPCHAEPRYTLPLQTM